MNGKDLTELLEKVTEKQKKKKQIEEIANMLIAYNNPFIDVPIEIIPKIAETLYNESYRKQSDTVKEFVCKVLQMK